LCPAGSGCHPPHYHSSADPFLVAIKKQKSKKKLEKTPKITKKIILNAMQFERKGRQLFFILRTLSGQTDNTVFYFL
jgi:hypothetical protein